MWATIYGFHKKDIKQSILSLVILFVIVNVVNSFYTYGMPMFYDMESKFIVNFIKQMSLVPVLSSVFHHT